MALVSTIPAAKAALLVLLKNQQGLSDAVVSWGVPTGPAARDWINLGNASSAQRASGLNPIRLPRDEEYDLEIVVITTRQDQQTATERAFVLAGEIEQAVRSKPTLDSLVTWIVVSGMRLEERPESDTRQAWVTVTVSARARVQGA